MDCVDPVRLKYPNRLRSALTVSLGDYDEDEHERRERKNSEVDAAFDDERTQYDGGVEFSGESAEDLLSQYEQLNSE
jgi:hypothetical protein